jgi:branched-chain amino acid transport system substrate-binding protein
MLKYRNVLYAIGIAAAALSGPASAQNTDPIRIALIAPFSGDYSIYGEGYELGIELWKEMYGDIEVNGRKVEIVKVDERCDVNTGLSAYRRESANFIANIGPSCSGVVKAVIPLAEAGKKPMLYLGHGAGLTDGREPDGYRFRLTQPDAPLLDRFAEVMLQKWFDEGKKKAAILHDTTVTYGGSGAIAAEAAKKVGIELVATETFDLGTKDFTGQLLKVRESGAEAVMIITYAADQARLLQQMADLQMKLPVSGAADTPYLVSVETSHGTGDHSTALEGVYYYSDYVQGDSPTKLQEFNKRFVEKHKMAVLDIHYEGWLAMGILSEALKAPGATEGGEALRDAIQNVKFDLGGRTISFGPNGDQTDRVLFLGQIVNGEPTLVDVTVWPAN